MDILIILALKCVCKATFVQDNEKCLAIARKIQERFGFKLKLIQCQDNPYLSIAKFSFDRSEIEVNCFVSISYDIEDESFACEFVFIKIINRLIC